MRKRKALKQRWREYERRKAELRSRCLSPAEYEAAVRALAAKLKV